jgi:hypothetical protein
MGAPRRRLAPDRMTEEMLWRKVLDGLYQLAAEQPGSLAWDDRNLLARNAYACAKELQLRGVQLTMPLPTSSPTARAGRRLRSC